MNTRYGLIWRLGLLLSVSGLMASTAYAQPELSLEARTRVLEHWIEEQIAYNDVPGVVVGVLGGGDLVWSGAFGLADRESGRAMTTRTRFRMGSVSKIFTATAIIKLRDQGKLDLDDPVAKFLPWFSLALRDEGNRTAAAVDGERFVVEQLDGSRITLRHLLTHTGGLPREAAVPYWTDHLFPSSEVLAKVVPQQKALWPPGRTYQYSNLGLGLLGEIVRVASGSSYGEYVERALLAPLGMERSTAEPSAEVVADLAAGYMRRLPDGSRSVFEYYDTGALAGAANVISTLEDMVNFAGLHLTAAQAGKSRRLGAVVAPESLREMHNTQWIGDSFAPARGLGFSLSLRDGDRYVSHGGWIAGHRSHLGLVPEKGLAVIAMVNADDVSPSFFAYEALQVLAPGIVNGGKQSGQTKPGTSRYAGLEGTYSDPWGSYYEVMVLDGALFFYEDSYPPSSAALSNLTWLEPDGERGFVFGAAKDPVRFERGQDGTVVRVLRRSDYLFPVLADGTISVSMP